MADGDILIGIIASVITTVVSLGVIIQIFGQGILDKINRKWKEKQEKDLLELRSKLQKDESSFHNLLQLYKSSSDELQIKRIDAVITLWDILTEFKKISSPLLAIYSSLTDSEISNLNKNPKIIGYLKKELPNSENFLTSLERNYEKETKLRIFINDEVWEVYLIYRGFIIRLLFHYIKYFTGESDKNIPTWKNKENKEFLGIIVPQDELEEIYALNVGSSHFFTTYLEGRLLIEINRMFSGELNIKTQTELFEKIKKGNFNEHPKLQDMIDKPEFKLFSWMRG